MALSVGEPGLEDSRADILRAAATCFLERGYAVTSIDDVARALSATKGRIYHHFPSKADLFAEVFRAGIDMIYAAIEPYRNMPGPAIERWKKIATIHVRLMIDTKPFQRAVWEGVEMHLRGSTTPQQRDVFGKLLEDRSNYGNIFRETIAEAQQEGAMRFANLSIANQLMFMTLNSPIFWYTPRDGETSEDVDRIVEQVVAFALGGLGATEGIV